MPSPMPAVPAPAAALPMPRGITIRRAAALLGCSKDTVRRMIAAQEIVAWKPRPTGRRWLVDEQTLAADQRRMIEAARARQLVFEF